MSESTRESVIYEQPLNERMRAFLRLEHLIGRAEHQMRATDEWSSRAALDAIIDIVSLVNRTDLKTELIKELERQSATMDGLGRDPRVDRDRLAAVLDRIRQNLDILRAHDKAFGNELKGNELLTSVQQRSSIPAGTCDFDLPAYRFWLQRPAEDRQRELRQWFSAFGVVRDSIGLSLGLVRESAIATRETAPRGFFQRSLDTSHPAQLVRVSVPREYDCYSEISAGKHRFTVRFMRQESTSSRPVQLEEDVTFELLCCVI